MSMASDNPRAITGGNRPPEQTDWAKDETDRIVRDYDHALREVDVVLAEARELPNPVSSQDDVGKYSDLVVRMRDLKKRLDSYRTLEKNPHMRRGEAVDQLFFTQISKLEARSKTDPKGAMDVLTKRVNEYQTKIAEEERRRRLEEQEQLRKIAAAAEAARLAEETKASEVAEAADRARKPEKVEALQETAHQHKVNAEVARVSEDAARTAHSEAKVAAAAKPADLVRTRSDGGTLATMRQVGFCEIVDASQLDKEKLWPFLKQEHILMALKTWAKTMSHKHQMTGAIIEMRNDTVFR